MATANDGHTDPHAYFTQALEAFNRCAGHTTVATRRLIVGGTSVRLHFAGTGMDTALFPALAHLESADPCVEPPLEVHIWDTASTDVLMPPPTWPLGACQERGEITAFANSRVRATYNPNGCVLELWDRPTNRAIVWAYDHSLVSYGERGAPLCRVLSWWLAHRGRQLVHGAAVGTGDSCVLLPGRGGSGKSVTALVSLGAGLTYLADDFCVLDLTGEPSLHSVYGTAKVHSADLWRVPFLTATIDNAPRLAEEKALCYLPVPFRQQIRRCARLRAIVLPQVVSGPATRLIPAGTSDATRAITTSTMALLAYAGGEVLRASAAAVRRVPAYHLQIGENSEQQIPILLRSLAEGHVPVRSAGAMDLAQA